MPSIGPCGKSRVRNIALRYYCKQPIHQVDVAESQLASVRNSDYVRASARANSGVCVLFVLATSTGAVSTFGPAHWPAGRLTGWTPRGRNGAERGQEVAASDNRVISLIEYLIEAARARAQCALAPLGCDSARLCQRPRHCSDSAREGTICVCIVRRHNGNIDADGSGGSSVGPHTRARRLIMLKLARPARRQRCRPSQSAEPVGQCRNLYVRARLKHETPERHTAARRINL